MTSGVDCCVNADCCAYVPLLPVLFAQLVWSKPRIDGIAPTARSRMFMVYINKCIFMFGGTNGSM